MLTLGLSNNGNNGGLRAPVALSAARDLSKNASGELHAVLRPNDAQPALAQAGRRVTTSCAFVTQKEAEAKQANLIMGVFRQWDTDGSGSITRKELKKVMRSLMGRMSEEDIDVLMDEADTNRNGLIDLEEFTAWLMKPAKESTGKAIFDYAEAFRPIFNIYDRDRTGSISKDEFVEVHCILQGALTMFDSSDDEMNDPLDLQEDSEEVFRQINGNDDDHINFREFVEWMKEHIPPNMPTHKIRLLTTNLARTLNQTFKVVSMAEAGELSEEDGHILENVLRKLVDTTKEFQAVMDGGAKSDAELAKQAEPLFGLNIERLKGMHMKRLPMNLGNFCSVDYQVYCFPVLSSSDEAGKRDWIAELVRKAIYANGKAIEAEPAYYKFLAGAFSWQPVEEAAAGKKEFDEVLAAIAPDVGLMCLVEGACNFGASATWADVLWALTAASYLGFVGDACRKKIIDHMKERLFAEAKLHKASEQETEEQAYTRHKREECVLQHVSLKGMVVLGMISETGLLARTPAAKG